MCVVCNDEHDEFCDHVGEADHPLLGWCLICTVILSPPHMGHEHQGYVRGVIYTHTSSSAQARCLIGRVSDVSITCVRHCE